MWIVCWREEERRKRGMERAVFRNGGGGSMGEGEWGGRWWRDEAKMERVVVR